MIAFGIQLSIDGSCNGVVVFEAKTDDLEQHYIRDFGARQVASLYPDGPKTLPSTMLPTSNFSDIPVYTPVQMMNCLTCFAQKILRIVGIIS